MVIHDNYVVNYIYFQESNAICPWKIALTISKNISNKKGRNLTDGKLNNN